MRQHKKARSETQKRAAFLAALESTGNVCAACKSSKVSRPTVYRWRDADADFAKAWTKALDRGTDALEDEAVRRASEGTLKPVFQGGRKVGQIREFSDTLLIFLLKGRRPEKYKDRVSTTIGGNPENPVVVKNEPSITLRPQDIVNARRLVELAGYVVPGHGGQQPVDPGQGKAEEECETT